MTSEIQSRNFTEKIISKLSLRMQDEIQKHAYLERKFEGKWDDTQAIQSKQELYKFILEGTNIEDKMPGIKLTSNLIE